MTKHAIFAPSAAHRWLEGGCTAYPEAAARLPQEESGEHAERGTFVHKAIEMHLTGELPDPYLEPRLEEDEAANVLSFAAFVDQFGEGKRWIEHRLMFNPEVWGTADFIHWAPSLRMLSIVDYKNGFVDVPVFNNAQLLTYGAAALRRLTVDPDFIRFVIYQPNSIAPVPRFKQWVATREQVENHAVRIEEILKSPRVFKAGEHCRYCPLFGKCDATQDLLQQLAPMLVQSPGEVSDDMLAAYLALRRPIDDWFKALEKDGLQRLATRKIPGVAMGASNKHRVWTDDNLVVSALVDRFGAKGVKPVSPSQAEKLGAKDLVEQYSTKPRGEPILVFEDDPRANLVPTRDVAKVFAGVKL